MAGFSFVPVAVLVHYKIRKKFFNYEN